LAFPKSGGRNRDATDLLFGVALDAVGSGLTATIRVLIVQAVGVAALTQSGPAVNGVTHAVVSAAIAVASGTVGLGPGGALAMTLAERIRKPAGAIFRNRTFSLVVVTPIIYCSIQADSFPGVSK